MVEENLWTFTLGRLTMKRWMGSARMNVDVQRTVQCSSQLSTISSHVPILSRCTETSWTSLLWAQWCHSLSVARRPKIPLSTDTTVCTKTLLFLQNIKEFPSKCHYRAHYLVEPLVLRTHGHSGCTALVLEDLIGIITFVVQYVENHGIFLPGGYKRDDV